MAEIKPRHGSMVVTRMGGEYHVLFQPNDLPHHYLSVARFQDRGRAVTYAEIEGCWVDDEGTKQSDALGVTAIEDPNAAAPNHTMPMSVVSPPTLAEGGRRQDGEVMPVAEPVKPVVVEAQAVPVPPTAPTPPVKPAVAVATPAQKSLPPGMAEMKERALDHYAKHGGTQADVAAATSIAPGTLGGFLTSARKDGDPRIAKGDAVQRAALGALVQAYADSDQPVTVVAASLGITIGKLNYALNQARAAGDERIKLGDARRETTTKPIGPRTHAEVVEAAKRAVPAPIFSRPGGATVRTG